MRRILAAALPLLLVTISCERYFVKSQEKVYAPTAEGLTLIYENSSLDSEARLRERIQLRVAESKPVAGGQQILVTYASLRGQVSARYLLKQGGMFLLNGDKVVETMLPEGFPEKVSEPGATRGRFVFLGRATANLPGLQLPSDFDRVGVWVEVIPPQGPHRRNFYLSGIGEADSLELRNGTWVSVSRLVSRGFTDAPELKSK
jgi:hypothetical protein